MKKTINANYDYIFKIVAVGDSGTGKTSLLCRYTEDKFYSEHLSTIGVDFKIKTVEVPPENPGEPVRKCKLQIWDTAGQERFNALIENYFRGAKGVFVVFALDDAMSFKHVQSWIGRLEHFLVPTVMLVGNKADLGDKRVVTTAQIRSLCEKNANMEYIETSALTGQNVSDAFARLAARLVKDLELAARLSPDAQHNEQIFGLQGVDPYAEPNDDAVKKECRC
jgi:Ras-related protein Rab-1A